MKYKYKVNGLDCANCTQKLEDSLNKKEEINDCVISFATGMMTFESEYDIDDHELLSFMQSIEDEVTIENLLSNITHHEHHEEHKHDHEHHHDHECGCHHEHDHNCCGHEHHHHDHECGCGHHHEHVENHRELANAIKYNIVGLDCANCASKVETEIKKQSYIEDAVVNFSTQKLMVKAKNDPQLLDKLQAVVDSVEEGVTLSKEDDKKEYSKPKLFNLKENIELVEGIIIFIGAHLFTGGFSTFLYLFAYLLIGYKVILKAIKNIGRKDFLDENFLMCLATFGAIALGDYNEAIAVMLFYAIGEIFQGYAVNKTRSSISSLMDIKSEYATIVKDEQMIQVTPEEVNVGDTIVVKVGEKVPLDGKVIKGNSMLDTASLTGESVPRRVEVGDEVLSGVVNLNDILFIEVTKHYADSTVSRIIDLVENSASKKAKIEKFITRFAKVYTPTVVGLAILLLIVPMIILPNQSFYIWLYRACTFLVVSCPCALVISVPLGLYAGIGKASALGVLVKGGNYLELLKDIDTVVFDKTGTLTKGEFEVVETSNDDLLEIGAYGEYMSNHPIARSIVKAYGKEIDSSRIEDFKEIAGKGLAVVIDHQNYYLGNEKYFKELNLSVLQSKKIGTIVHIACGDQYLGYIVVADVIKESTIPGIQDLKKAHVKQTVMLTGDHSIVANDIAKRTGIDQVYSDLLPQDKVSQLENLMSGEHVVAFVGDGINDAPVLARSDIGIAMGGVGSDVAIEAADVVLMSDDITAIAKAIDVSHYTNFILKENVTFTLVIKIGVLILTLFGLTNMWMGVFADVGVTLIAICNSMRILYKKS